MNQGAEVLVPSAPVLVRVAQPNSTEYPSRVEDIDADTFIIGAPASATAALLASGSREVEVSWLSPRGRYEQLCLLVENNTAAKQWRLRPLRRPVLIQRRRYVRVSASVPVRVYADGVDTPGTTVDVSEGGFRVRLPRRAISELARTTVQATMGGAEVAIPGYVLRSTDVLVDQTEAVIAFDADGSEAEAIRRFVLNTQLRARTARQNTVDPN
jgi:c-di-GMP-binding flagellar brake protein YcgR